MMHTQLCIGCNRLFNIYKSEKSRHSIVYEDNTCAILGGKESKPCVDTKLKTITVVVHKQRKRYK